MIHKNSSYSHKIWRVRWDLNPRSPAPKADTLIRARLRALSMPLGWATHILVLCRCWVNCVFRLSSVRILLFPQIVSACGAVIVELYVALRAVTAHLIAIVWVSFRDFDWFPFFVAAVESLGYWSVAKIGDRVPLQ
jgi:hypothetical protein